MSTRSTIITKTDTGYAGIYCHSDGYLDHVGSILLHHYKDQEKVSQLIALGDISSLGPEIGVKHDFDWMRTIWTKKGFDVNLSEEPEDKMVNAYMRDRGETGCEAKTGVTSKEVEDQIETGYAYVFEDGTWTVNGDDLAEAIAKGETEA